MRHRVAGKQLGRSVGQRNALRRTMITQFFEHERITTTRAKAEAIRGAAEEMITKAKRSLAHEDPMRSVATRRLLAGRLNSTEVVNKLFDEIAPRFTNRPGGYTRVFRLGPRKGDAAEMVVLELVDRGGEGAGGPQSITQRAGGLINRIRGRGRNRPQEGDEKSS